MSNATPQPIRTRRDVGAPEAQKDPNTDLYTGRWCRVAVTYVMRDVQRWGLPADMCVMSIRPVEAQA